jgi:hypothetical protein
MIDCLTAPFPMNHLHSLLTLALTAATLASCSSSGDHLPVSAARATANLRAYLSSPASPPHFGTRFAGEGPDGSMGTFLLGQPTKVNHASAPVAVFHLTPQGPSTSRLDFHVRPQSIKSIVPPPTPAHRKAESAWRPLLRSAASR